MASDSTQASRRGLTLVALMILVVFLPFATNAADSDGDGIEDSHDEDQEEEERIKMAGKYPI